MGNFKKYTEVNFSNYKEIVKQLEIMGDEPDYEKNVELQKEFEELSEMIRNFDNIHYPIRRSFSVGDWVVYKPYENCKESDISGKGKIIEDLMNGNYKVTFGHNSIHGTRTGEYSWSNLWKVIE
jgi:hypothetical protein